MLLEDANKIIEMLKENEFNVIDLSENAESLDDYYTASEFARRIDIRLPIEIMSEALKSLGYKIYFEKVGLPSNPENSAVVLKYSEDDITGVKDYYIQCLWKKEELENINHKIMTNEYFEQQKQPLIQKNKETISDILNSFKNMEDYVVLSLKKTGFNLKHDFIIYIAYTIFNKEKGLISSGYFLIDDDIDDIKIKRYLNKSETTGMSPFDYLKLQLPPMDDCNFRELFLSRLNVLRRLYSLTKRKNVVFYSDLDEKFLNKLFEKEELPREFIFSTIKNRSFYFKDLIDWLEPKESYKLKDVYSRYQVNKKSNEGFQQDAIMLNELIYKVLKKY